LIRALACWFGSASFSAVTAMTSLAPNSAEAPATMFFLTACRVFGT
jgi:hypothetical protein